MPFTCKAMVFTCRYNLLGGPLDMDIPLDANVLVLRIQSDRDMNAQEGSLESCRIQVRRRPLPNPRNPRLLERYRQLLLGESLSMSPIALRSVLSEEVRFR